MPPRAVLVYVSRENCPACMRFDPQWVKIANSNPDVAYRKFTVKLNGPGDLPRSLGTLEKWYPCLSFVPMTEYSKAMSYEEKGKDIELQPSGKMDLSKIAIYNSVTVAGVIQHKSQAGMPIDASDSATINNWVARQLQMMGQNSSTAQPAPAPTIPSTTMILPAIGSSNFRSAYDDNRMGIFPSYSQFAPATIN